MLFFSSGTVETRRISSDRLGEDRKERTIHEQVVPLVQGVLLLERCVARTAKKHDRNVDRFEGCWRGGFPSEPGEKLVDLWKNWMSVSGGRKSQEERTGSLTRRMKKRIDAP
jgi:hypothetical protein